MPGKGMSGQGQKPSGGEAKVLSGWCLEGTQEWRLWVCGGQGRVLELKRLVTDWRESGLLESSESLWRYSQGFDAMTHYSEVTLSPCGRYVGFTEEVKG